MQEFSFGTHLFFGAGALEKLSSLNYRRIFLVTDGFFVRNGTVEKITKRCPDACVKVFDKVQPDPSVRLVGQGVAEAKGFQPDAIVALGGGSAIDCAKGIVAVIKADLIAVPTTSGTGSEVTSFAVVSHDGVKHPLVDAQLRPKIAILDEDLLTQLPQSLIAEAGMDAVSHCVEAMFSKNATIVTDALAKHALEILLQMLPLSYQGDASVRGQIHCAATMAGMAFDAAGLGICHALSHAIGGQFHLPHGRINAVLLPAVMRFHGGNAFAVERLRRSLKLPTSLTQAGLERTNILAKLDEICQAAMNDPCCKTNPKEVTQADLERIVRQVL